MVTSVGQDTVTGLATRAPDRRSTESQSRFLLVGEIHAAVLYLPVAEGAQGPIHIQSKIKVSFRYKKHIDLGEKEKKAT